ncbi:hypothetical protein OH809_08795 [Streptomyces sp. NBC_00873]|uniref:hypothetical protein n=1 Tax=Streptomyces sp. NBC_00873 TaxID=2975852 RepID=UPI00386EA8F4|nr:hypothetical protein OH809_08795 [Streptomyces sp. NBC_00873]
MAGDPLVDGVRESVARHAQPAIAQGMSVHVAGLGLDAERRGAVASAIGQVLSIDRYGVGPAWAPSPVSGPTAGDGRAECKDAECSRSTT